jgi:hypothetical protein
VQEEDTPEDTDRVFRQTITFVCAFYDEGFGVNHEEEIIVRSVHCPPSDN